MPAAQRGFGQAASLHDSIIRGIDFSDAALQIPIEEVLRDSSVISRIGQTVATKCGVNLQLEGESESKKVVTVAYDVLDDLTRRSFGASGVDRTAELFQSDTTHATLAFLSRNMNNLALMKLAYRYRKGSPELAVTDDGLETTKDFELTRKMKTKRDGCPYAAGSGSRYFNLFNDHIIETLAEAHDTGMPLGWLERINRTLRLSQ